MGGSGAGLITDYQLHWFPRPFYEALLDRTTEPFAEADGSGGFVFHMSKGGYFPVPDLFCNLDGIMEELDRNGVGAGVFSTALLADPGPFEAAFARELSLLLNEVYAEAQREWGGRFIGLATLPLHSAELAIEVLDDAVQRLGLRGVLMNSNAGGRSICTPELTPLWRRIEELRVPVFLHPAMRSAALPALTELGYHPVLDRYLGGWYDASLAGLSLILSGLLDELPELIVVQPHLGAMLPFFRAKFDETETRFQSQAAERSTWYFRNRFYTDCVAWDAPALALGIAAYGLERVLYGSDYAPRLTYPEALSFVRDNLPAEQAEQIFANTLPLLPLSLA